MRTLARLFSVIATAFIALYFYLPAVRAFIPNTSAVTVAAHGTADQDTVTAVTNLVTPGTTVAELMAKGFTPDSIIKPDDGTVVYLYRNVRYVISHGGAADGVPVRIKNGPGPDLKVVFAENRVVDWQFTR